MIDMECQQTCRASTKKWKLENHGLKSRNDEVGIIKQSRGDCMKDMKDQH